MPEIIDFFFSPYPTNQELRLHAAIEDGLAHGSCIEPRDPAPGETVTLRFSSNALKPIEHVAIYFTTDGTEPLGEKGVATNGNVVVATPGKIIHDTAHNQSIRLWEAVLPAQRDGTLVRYRVDGWSVRNPEGYWNADSVDPVSMPAKHGRIFAYHVDRWTTPQWWNDAIVYHIFVDRFSAASDEPRMLEHDAQEITGFFGGTLNGVTEKLDYIELLGANCIWLSPIFESPTHHGYNSSDYFTVASRYGGNEALHRLIQEAHNRGMHVMLDFVANHTSDEHLSFIDALNNPDSETYDWYAFGDWPPYGYRSYALVGNMPELITENPGVQRYLFDAALYWLGHFGADALRLDYVPGPPHAFWTAFQQEVKEHFPQALTLGEITAPITEIANYAGRIDGFMDFPLAKLLRSVFGLRQTSLADLLTFINKRAEQLPAGMSRATLLDNHDMHRFLWLAKGDLDRLKLATLCYMTLDGTPIIYYGTEVGLSQYEDAHKENAYARAPMLWDERQDKSLFEYHRHLIQLRHTHPCLRTGSFTPIAVQRVSSSSDDVSQVGAYLRRLHDDFILVVLNNSKSEVKIRLPLAEALATLENSIDIASTMRDLLHQGNEKEYIIQDDGNIEIILSALSAVMLEPTSKK